MFNGGFQPKHGHWGLVANRVVVSKPREDGCPILLDDGGGVRIGPSSKLAAEIAKAARGVEHKQIESYFEKFDKKLDVIYVCDDLRIGPKIGPTWGGYRADLNLRFTRHTVRVHVQANVAVYTATSGVIHGASVDQARDLPTAILFIKEQRRRRALAS